MFMTYCATSCETLLGCFSVHKRMMCFYTPSYGMAGATKCVPKTWVWLAVDDVFNRKEVQGF
jgi:hypothetical protein